MGNVNLVFLHGAGLGNFIWDDIKPLIKHPAFFVEFPNRMGGDTLNKGLTLQDYVDHVIHQIEAFNILKFVIVSHSISGGIGLKICNYFGTSVSGFIGISSVIPEKNSSFISCVPFPQKLIMPSILNLLGTKPPNKSILHELCNDLSELQSDKVVRSFTPESKSIYTTKVNYKKLKCETLYVKLLDDKSLPISIQDRMIKNLNPKKVLEVQSGHLPMISRAKELATIINNFIITK